MRMAYGAASLVVSRAGSGSIFEIAASGLPSIIIPLTGSAQEHQRENAYAYAKSGAYRGDRRTQSQAPYSKIGN